MEITGPSREAQPSPAKLTSSDINQTRNLGMGHSVSFLQAPVTASPQALM